MEFKTQLHEFFQWRKDVSKSIEMYCDWRDRYGLNDAESSERLLTYLRHFYLFKSLIYNSH
ncbi:hypothetical protein [Bathymodiolus japonicus methanotrophic gill symbiont]|uniref:hypothetical protein n=1 Tax=Bathymodiolus japonicus methanotrophic gill symbiont TaxID=113269 RepID=UPI001C8D093C|nr:hypothetical protein [Bathymodiolus japonicus methanotrophic gill symbiont]